MANSYAFGYLCAKLEEINGDADCSFSDIIGYANDFASRQTRRLAIVLDDEMLEEICAIYSHCEDFDYNGKTYWIVGECGNMFGVVWLDTEMNQIHMLRGEEKERMYELYEKHLDEKLGWRDGRLPVATPVVEPVAIAVPVAEVVSAPETVRVIRVNSNLQRAKKNEGGIYLWDRNENVIYNAETKQEIGIVANGSILFW